MGGLGRRVSEGGARWNFCNCWQCAVAVARAKAGDWGDGDIGILGDGGDIIWKLRNMGGFGHQFAACRSGTKAIDLPGGARGRRANGNRGKTKGAKDGWRTGWRCGGINRTCVVAVDQTEVIDTRGSREASGGEAYSIASTSSAAPRGQRFDGARAAAFEVAREWTRTAALDDMAARVELLESLAEVPALFTAPTAATFERAEPEVVHWRHTKPAGGR